MFACVDIIRTYESNTSRDDEKNKEVTRAQTFGCAEPAAAVPYSSLRFGSNPEDRKLRFSQCCGLGPWTKVNEQEIWVT